MRGNPPVGIRVEHRLDWLVGPDAVDVALADVHLDLERRHVDDRADAGSRETAARRHRRDHLARLCILRDGHAVERGAHGHVGQVGFPGPDMGLRDRHLLLSHAMRAFRLSTAGVGRIDFGEPNHTVLDELIESLQRNLGLAKPRLILRRTAPRRFELRARDVEVGSNLRIIETRKDLSAPDCLALFDEDLHHLAGDLRGNGRPPPRCHVAGRVEHCPCGHRRRRSSTGRCRLDWRRLQPLGPEPRRRPRRERARARPRSIHHGGCRRPGAVIDSKRSEIFLQISHECDGAPARFP